MTKHLPPPPDLGAGVGIRQRYTAVATVTSEPRSWSKCRVDIFDSGELIYSYDRNYSFMRTFEPFRQWDGESWHNYALISPRYSTFQVLDLESRSVIAERPYPQRPWHRAGSYDQYAETRARNPEWFEPGGVYYGKGPDDLINGEGFCAVEFYVPDWASWDSDGDGGGGVESMDTETWEEMSGYREDIHTGQLGFVAGCYWGDDSSWKIEAVDLSRISEGIISQDNRFGYISLPSGMRLRAAVEYMGGGVVTIATPLQFEVGGALRSWQKKALLDG